MHTHAHTRLHTQHRGANVTAGYGTLLRPGLALMTQLGMHSWHTFTSIGLTL